MSLINQRGGRIGGALLSLSLLAALGCGPEAPRENGADAPPPGVEAGPDVASVQAMEFYIDEDPGEGNGTPIPARDGAHDGTVETGEIDIDTSGLTPGPHMVHVRALGSNGVWGTSPPTLLCVYNRAHVSGAEWFIDTDPGEGNGVSLPGIDGSLDSVEERIGGEIDVAGLSHGDHTLFIRARDSFGTWGPARQTPLEILRTSPAP
jgi:hypothetical protein